jgi:hypothetical protein
MLKGYPLVSTFIDGPLGIYDEYGNQDWKSVAASVTGSLVWITLAKMAYDRLVN